MREELLHVDWSQLTTSNISCTLSKVSIGLCLGLLVFKNTLRGSSDSAYRKFACVVNALVLQIENKLYV